MRHANTADEVRRSTSHPDSEREKRAAAEFAARLIEDGMVVGLGTGSTVAYLLPALATRHLVNRCVATSPATASAAAELGLDVEPFDNVVHLDIAIDGADQVAGNLWLVKGGGGAHTRERIVAAASERFVVIVSSEKLVGQLAPPVPLELLDFGLSATVTTLNRLGEVVLRPVPASPDGGRIADLHCSIDDPEQLSATLDATPGVLSHGLFPPQMVGDLVVGRGNEVVHRTFRTP
jgi:ribose 5-phosphate isomerase A